MELLQAFPAFNMRAFAKNRNLLPVVFTAYGNPVTCSHCSFVNKAVNNFCTNCSYPICPTKDRLVLYNFRMKARKELLVRCENSIIYARNVLYILSTVCFLGLAFLFRDSKQAEFKGVLMSVLAVLFLLLARGSIKNPFPSLLISFLMLLTVAAINTWSNFDTLFTTATGVYMLIAQCIILFYLLNGVKGAFRLDVMVEEFKI
ncbi:MAG: zinc ribbon protein [Segetibacter sp.]|nr:zinc ribbon protein [Segetibacter sp.]